MNIYKNSRVKIFTFVIVWGLCVLSACGDNAPSETVGGIDEKIPTATQAAAEPVVADPTLTPKSAEETPTAEQPTEATTQVEESSITPDAPTETSEESGNFVYPIIGTNQTIFYNNTSIMSEPGEGEDFYGQNANYPGNIPSYTDNGDGTITDNVTGLMWSQTVDLNGDGVINNQDKLSYDEAVASAPNFNLAGYTDWRLPAIKEVYSLILFSGNDISGYSGTTADGIPAFIDANYFAFGYGDVDAGGRLLEGQVASLTKYGTTTRGEETMFGVNFVDGRIKGYGLETSYSGGPEVFYVMYVRGNENY